MRSLIINKSNWTGQNIQIFIDDEKRTVALEGATYTLEQRGEEVYNILSSEHSNLSIGWVGKMGDGEWVAKSEFSDITRGASDPFVAVAKLMCNL